MSDNEVDVSFFRFLPHILFGVSLCCFFCFGFFVLNLILPSTWRVCGSLE